MKLESYSHKAQEKFADSLLAMSNVLFSGLLITILVAPMASMLKLMFSPEQERLSILQTILILPSPEALVFVLLYGAVAMLGFHGRLAGMKIYSRLYPDAD